MLAPIVLFAHNRLDHLQKTLEALGGNSLASESELIIYADGPKNTHDVVPVNKVRAYLQSYKKENPFAQCHLIESEYNKGLSCSIVGGVTSVIAKMGKVIVLEDDIITAPDFLTYMNTALDYYQEKQCVFSVGGFTLPLVLPKNYPYDVIATQRMSSYCWGTWQDRWDSIDWDLKTYPAFRFNFFQRKSFNRWGNDRSSMLDDQHNNRIDSWAIRFEYNMWRQNAINILPVNTRANSIGNDGSGTHASSRANVNASLQKHEQPLRMADVGLNDSIRTEYQNLFRVPAYILIKRYLGNLIFKLIN